MRPILLAISIAVLASPAVAEECRYYAPNGDNIAVDDGYIVLFTKDSNLFCMADGDQKATTYTVDCPTADGEDDREIELTLRPNGQMLFDDRTWLKRCTTGA
jgi:hypothetical protein